jgi:hypothetical protein
MKTSPKVSLNHMKGGHALGVIPRQSRLGGIEGTK